MTEGIPAEADKRSEIAALLHEQFARLTKQLRTIELPQGMTPERLSALTVIEKRGPDLGYGFGGQGNGPSGYDVAHGHGARPRGFGQTHRRQE